jgi:hypothetical protein
MNTLILETRSIRFEPPADFYNPNLTIVTHKTAPKLSDQISVKQRSLSALLNSKRVPNSENKDPNYLNNLGQFENALSPAVSKNAPLKQH